MHVVSSRLGINTQQTRRSVYYQSYFKRQRRKPVFLDWTQQQVRWKSRLCVEILELVRNLREKNFSRTFLTGRHGLSKTFIWSQLQYQSCAVFHGRFWSRCAKLRVHNVGDPICVWAYDKELGTLLLHCLPTCQNRIASTVSLNTLKVCVKSLKMKAFKNPITISR